MREECGSRDGNSGLSRESSRDDINSICEQQFEYEERFRVDRRKLELMMIGAGGAGQFKFVIFFSFVSFTNVPVQ
jgi:hypothetical protein